jgi:choline-sulfatase
LGGQNLPGQQRLKKSSIMTGYFPAQTGVKWTLEQSMQGTRYPPLDLPNLATVMSSVGYSTPYQGKFHLTKYPCQADGFVPADVDRYGFQRWDPQDADANQAPSEFGGGDANNDGRFMNQDGAAAEGEEGVIAYLKSDAAREKPFFLVGLPEKIGEDLSTKPE